MTEVFDPQRARRLAVLRQSTAPNVIKINPDTASFLRRYEDADVSRLKLLEAQRLRQEGETERELIKLQKKRLKKRLRGRGSGLPKGRGSRAPRADPPQKSALEVEIEREKQLEDIRKQKKKEEVEEERFAAERVDARLERRRLERATRQEARLADDRLFFEGFQRAQDRQQLLQIADRDAQQRILDRQQLLQIEDRREVLAIADRRAERLRFEQELAVRRGELAAGRAERAQIRQERLEDRQEQARLQDRREELQARQIAAAQESNREIQAQQLRLIEEDRARYDREVRSLQQQRDQDAARLEAERADVRERVARDDAFRHAQLQEQQRLALENLAQQQRDNTARDQLEQNRIDNQRVIDAENRQERRAREAERAITDRELIQGFTAAIESLNTQRDQDPQRIGPTAEQLGGNIRDFLRSGVGAEVQPEPQPQPEPALTEATTTTTTGSAPDLSTQAEEVTQIQDNPDDPTPRATVAERRQREGRSPSPRRSPQRQPLTLEEASGSSVSSSEEGLDPGTQRTLSIMSGIGAPLGRQRERQETGTNPGDLIPTGELGERGFPKLAQRKVVEGRATSPTIGSEAIEEGQPNPRGTPPRPQGTPAGRPGGGQIETVAEDSTLQQVGGAIGGALGGIAGGLARGAGGIVGGVAQGIGEQLPAASDVGAAVGRAGVSAVAGLGGAIYEGLAGGEQEDEPLDRGD
jgi:hypothetical protein